MSADTCTNFSKQHFLISLEAYVRDTTRQDVNVHEQRYNYITITGRDCCNKPASDLLRKRFVETPVNHIEHIDAAGILAKHARLVTVNN